MNRIATAPALAALIAGVLSASPGAAATVSTVEGESFPISTTGLKVITDSTASGGKALALWSNREVVRSVSLLSASTGIVVRARGRLCSGGPILRLTVDGTVRSTTTVKTTSWASFTVPVSLSAGTHSIRIAFVNDYRTSTCDRNLYLDKLTFTIATSATPAPTPTATPTATASPSVTATTPSTTLTGTHLIVDRAALMALPMSGTAWTAMKKVADGALGTVDLNNQDNMNAPKVFAAALVYARTGDPAYKDKVLPHLRALPTASMATARVLSVSRQIGGYAMAADLVGYRDPAFVDFMRRIRTHNIGNHGRWTNLTYTSEDSASNWGAWALAARIAASAYVGDTTDVSRAATVFRGFLGNRAAYAGFRPTNEFEPAWSCDGTVVGINAACGFRDGAIVEDIARSGNPYPGIDATGLMYSWETLAGAILSARLLQRAGYADVFSWSDKAMLRAARFLHRTGGYPLQYTTSQHAAWTINKAYGVTLGPVATTAGYGRQYGFTDWLP